MVSYPSTTNPSDRDAAGQGNTNAATYGAGLAEGSSSQDKIHTGEATFQRIPQDDVPAVLRPGHGAMKPQEQAPTGDKSHFDQIPESLLPGGGALTSNPFRAKMAAQEPPQPPSEAFENLKLEQSSNNPWGPTLMSRNEEPRASSPQLLPTLAEQDPWAAPQPAMQPPAVPPTPVVVPPTPEEQGIWRDAGVGSGQNQPQETPKPHNIAAGVLDHETSEEQQAWQDVGEVGKGKGRAESVDEADADEDDWNMIESETSSLAPEEASKPEPVPNMKSEEHVAQNNPEMHQGFYNTTSDMPQAEPNIEAVSSGTMQNQETTNDQQPELVNHATNKQPTADPGQVEQIQRKPALPPRQQGVLPKWTPTRQPVDGQAETYQIKNIRWTDPATQKNPRTSPILIQNENGPCPLVALVNALSMTTPADIPDTALVQALRSRERVSLNLVLDLVFDELMSPRRTSSEVELPDVTELYSFLQSLHTGMNVNPRFLPTSEMVTAYKRSSLTHLPPTERDNLMPGTFENSMEMALYATFRIPLIHGWLPPKSDPVYQALERQASSYEDVQNLLFREEELEEKLSSPGHGLSGAEQQLYQDIMTIKMFMSDSATQLTPWGIEVITRAMHPGTFAILFRNDHFSTLYCHPQTGQLMTLVTDAGYKSHDEVVWETLADVNGERTEILSGDFRRVSSGGAAVGSSHLLAQSSEHGGGEWTTVQGKRGKGRQPEPVQEQEPESAAIDAAEQADRDLALALQLQEEEEQRDREDRARRRRESLLSEQYIEQQAQQPRPVNRGGDQRSPSGNNNSNIAPARQSSNSVNVSVTSSQGRRVSTQSSQSRPSTQDVRPLIPPRRQGVNRRADSSDDAPPSYEQAAHDPAYVPPVGHPNHPASSVDGDSSVPVSNTGPPRIGAFNAPRPIGTTGGRMQSQPMMGPGGVSRNRDCVVM